MPRAFAGAFGAPLSTAVTGVLRRFGHPRRVTSGGLHLALTGPAPVERDGVLCLVDGVLHGLDAAELALRWKADGDAALADVRGEFCAVLWDGEGGVLVRDQVGSHGIVWTRAGAGVVFAGDVAPLLAALPRRPGPDHAAVAAWLAVGGPAPGATLYEGVHRLAPGELLPLGAAGAVRPRRYWEPRRGAVLGGSADELAGALREGIETAIARRTAGGDAAVMLSGGLDSGTIAALGGVKRSYSAVFPDHPAVDESALLDELGGALGLEQTWATVRGGSVLGGALPYLATWELPPVSPNLFFWRPLLRRAADDGVRVLLDGEGGDELFGLSVGLLADHLRAGRVRDAYALVHQVPGADRGLDRDRALKFLARHGAREALPHGLHRALRFARGVQRHAPPWFRPEVARAHALADDPSAWKREPGARWQAELLGRTLHGTGPALAYDHVRRRAAMADLEVSHPLMDVDLLELVLRIPPELAYDPAISRPLLRRASGGVLPDAVRLRPGKSSFDAIFHDALAGPDLPAIRTLLGAPDAEIGAWVDLAQLRPLLVAPPPGQRGDWALHVWRLVTAELWLRAQVDREAPARAVGRLPTADVKLARKGTSTGS
jgi:asparagine synthase (glutamine-hydrolysing)